MKYAKAILALLVLSLLLASAYNLGYLAGEVDEYIKHKKEMKK